MNTIKSQWDSFAKDALPDNCSAVQREEMYKAFYAGAAGLFGLMTGGIGDMGEEAAILAMDGLHEEILAFIGSIPDA